MRIYMYVIPVSFCLYIHHLCQLWCNPIGTTPGMVIVLLKMTERGTLVSGWSRSPGSSSTWNTLRRRLLAESGMRLRNIYLVSPRLMTIATPWRFSLRSGSKNISRPLTSTVILPSASLFEYYFFPGLWVFTDQASQARAKPSGSGVDTCRPQAQKNFKNTLLLLCLFQFLFL